MCTLDLILLHVHVNKVSHPAYESWSNFKEELEVKFPPSWVELVSHEEVINNISCKKRFLNCWYHSILERIIVMSYKWHTRWEIVEGRGGGAKYDCTIIYCTHYSAQNFACLVSIILLVVEFNNICWHSTKPSNYSMVCTTAEFLINYNLYTFRSQYKARVVRPVFPLGANPVFCTRAIT